MNSFKDHCNPHIRNPKIQSIYKSNLAHSLWKVFYHFHNRIIRYNNYPGKLLDLIQDDNI